MYADDCYSAVVMAKRHCKILTSDSNNNICKNNNVLSPVSY